MRPYSCDSTSTNSLTIATANNASRQQPRQVSPSQLGMRSRSMKPGSTEIQLANSSPSITPGGSRAVSPAPKKNTGYSRGKLERLNTTEQRRNNELKCTDLGFSNKSLWDGSWVSHGLNAIQEIAFSMIAGSDDSEMTRRKNYNNEDWSGKGKGKERQDSWGPNSRSLSKNENMIGIGSSECRENKLKDMKRARILESRDNVHKVAEQARIYKRRTSVEESSPGSSKEDDYILAYVHNVLPQDTLQGIVIKYHSQMDVFKKTNRLWTDDSIQIRDKVFLPVDACSIKGKPCPAPQPNPLSQPGSSIPIPISNKNNNNGHLKSEKPVNSTGSSEILDYNENTWTHVRWVLLDSMPSTPVQVLRIPRKTLKYFPPRRKKSFASVSPTLIPQTSSDIPSSCRFSIDSQASLKSQRVSSTDYSLSKTLSVSPPSHRLPLSGRRESVSETADRLGWLRGPGGIGTLGKNVRKPGPANDALNSWTRKKFPGIAIDSLPSSSAISTDSALLQLNSEEKGPNSIGSTSTSLASGSCNDGLYFPNVNLSGVENWVRKMATRAQVPRISREDSIEMLDGAGSDDGRSHENVASQLAHTTPRSRKKEDDIETSVRSRMKGGKSE